jgi:hypothetical protein
VRGSGAHADVVAATVHDRKQALRVGRGILDVANPWMLGEACDNVEGEITALKLWIGVEHDRHVDSIGDREEIAFDLRVPTGK